MPPEIALFGLCLLLSGFFSGSETALLSASRMRLRRMAADGDRGADRALQLVKTPRRLLAGILVGNNIVNTLAASTATVYCVHGLALGEGKGVAIATGASTLLLVLFAEFLPKSLSAAHPEGIARKVALPVQGAIHLLAPAVWALQAMIRPLSSVFKAGRRDGIAVADLRVAVAESARTGMLDETMARILRGGLSLAWKTVADALVPRVDVRGVDVTSGYETCLELFRRDNYSRLLVMSGTPDGDLGYVSVKDMPHIPADQRASWKAGDAVRQALRVPATLPLAKLLMRMRRSGVHFAVVKDEHGGTDGIVTLEDVLEELVGEIRDEHDAEEHPPVRETAPGQWLVRGDVAVLEVNDRLGLQLEAEEAHTLGGLIAELLGRLPREGEGVDGEGVRLVAARVSGRRVLEVLVERRG